MNLKLFGGYQDTRSNSEDMALTPFLGLVYVNEGTRCYGISMSWIYYSVFIAIAINAPKEMKRFKKY